MNHLTALYFPDTAMPGRVLAPLSLFLDVIRYYRPAEMAETEAEAADPVVAFFARHGICRSSVPAPLGEEMPRYQRVLRELTSRENNMADSLRSLSLASLSDPMRADREESSTGSLRSAITRPAGGAKIGQAEKELWQARLVLSLGEIMDRQTEEVREGLARLTEQEQLLFHSLRGDEEDEDQNESIQQSLDYTSLAKQIAAPGLQDRRSLQSRLTAWIRLFLEDEKAVPADKTTVLLATGRPEAASFLLDGYERLRGNPPSVLATLAMPALSASPLNELFLDQRAAFREETMASRNRIEENLRHCVTTGRCRDDNDLADAVTVWNEAVVHHWPLKKTVPPHLTLYGFEATTLEQLLHHAANLSQQSPSQFPDPGGALLAVLA